MTTIAANRFMMASDTQVTDGAITGNMQKLFRVRNSILGICGDAMMARYFVEWFGGKRRSHAALHKALGDYERSEIGVIELNKTGIYLWDGWGVPLKLEQDYYAVGSGSPAAMAVLEQDKHLIKSPINAVLAAMKVDPYTGGTVIYGELKKGK